MSISLNEARDAAELGRLQGYFQEREIFSQYVDPNEEVPIPTLLVQVPDDEQGRERWVSFNYAPQDDDDFDTIRLIQLYATLPFQIDLAYRAELVELVLALSANSMLGNFYINNEENSVVTRYVFIQPDEDALNLAVMMETLQFFVFYQDLFSSAIEKVGNGSLSTAEALQQLTG